MRLVIGMSILGLVLQARWKEIGTTGSGNAVYVNTRSVTRADGVVTATVRVRYKAPVKTPKGELTSSRSIAMFDCARNAIAAKENTLFFDERANRVYTHTVNAKPGFGPAIKGSFADVALQYFCVGAGKP